MKKIDNKIKLINIKKSKKEILIRTKRNKGRDKKLCKERNIKNIKNENIKKKKYPVHNKKYDLPINFCIYENYDEVSHFFNDVICYLKKKLVNKKEFSEISIIFDASQIVQVTFASIIYLLALMNSFRHSTHKRIKFSGNLPNDSDAKEKFLSSGFLKFFNKNTFEEMETVTDGIRYGNGVYEPSVFRNMYVDLSKDKSKIHFLSTTLIEIIDNSVQHAYKKNNDIQNKEWYFFYKEEHECYDFTLLDTGVGIPETMRKNFKELVEKLLSYDNIDTKLLVSGLKGDFRTGTGEKNRGNGLPKIYENCINGNLCDMEIISGGAYCKIKKDGQIKYKDNSNYFLGTIYRWRILKEDLK